MSSSDSSDDSNDARLREAAVSFEDIDRSNKTAAKVTESNEAASADHHFNIDVTPEYQSFVAKKLTKMLDDSIEMVAHQEDRENTKIVTKKKKKLKFKLTKDIKYVEREGGVALEDAADSHNKKQREKKKKHSLSSDEDEDATFKQMCREAAITSDVIFQTTCINEHKKSFLE